VRYGDLSPQSFKTQRSRIKRYILPAIGPTPISQVSYQTLQALADDLISKRLHSSTVRQVINTVGAVSKHALRRGAIDRPLPVPSIKSDSIPRGAFTPAEVLQLWRASRRLSSSQGSEGYEADSSRGGLFSKKKPIPEEFRWMLVFMANSFIRPTDLKHLQHQHVDVIRTSTHRYLRLRLPESKRHTGNIVTLTGAVRVYESLRDSREKAGMSKPIDYLFYPEVLDRDAAMMAACHHFRRVSDEAGLRKGSRGQTRTLYSLRHTAITNRLLYGRGIDLLTLAKNARTSVEMIERFYASELNPEMNIAMIQSRRTLRTS
jgi:hypothetical protein